jgi:hypothetical protein
LLPGSSDGQPDPQWLRAHVAWLRESYRRLTGRDLIAPNTAAADAPSLLDCAGFAVVSHGTEADPVFNYANHCALDLFATNWAAFTRLPSRFSAEEPNRDSRAALLARVAQHGFADDYRGVRIGVDGRRFMIEDATVWNVSNERGEPAGQAARIGRWHFL